MLTRVTIPSSVLHLTTTRLEMVPLLPSTVIVFDESTSPLSLRYSAGTLCEEVTDGGRTDGGRSVHVATGQYFEQF
jgi:hypothetical protein